MSATPDTTRRTKNAFGWLQVTSAVVWAATMLGVAVVAKASDNFVYVLLVLITGSSMSSAAINAAARRADAT